MYVGVYKQCRCEFIRTYIGLNTVNCFLCASVLNKFLTLLQIFENY